MASVKSAQQLLQLAPPEGIELEILKKKNVKRQYFATICMDLLAFSFGATCGWPSPSLLLLRSPEDSPLESGPITLEEASWIASGMCLGGFVGNLAIGWVRASKSNK
jgi:hypothetical protein